MPPLAHVYGRLAGMPLEIVQAVLAEFSCSDLQTLVYSPHAPEGAIEAADVILAFRMGNLPAAAELMRRDDLVQLFTPDMLDALLRRQADVTLHAFADLRGALGDVGSQARQLLDTRLSLSLELLRGEHAFLHGHARA